MSQIYKTVSSSPSVPTQFVTDSGTAVPSANQLNVVTPGSGSQGIKTTGDNNTITITLTDAVLTGTAQTVNAGTATFNVNIPIPNNSSSSIRVNLAGIDTGFTVAIGGEIIGLAKNLGGTVTIVGTSDVTRNNDMTVSAWGATLIVSGTNALVQVTGVAGFTINWRAIIDLVSAP